MSAARSGTGRSTARPCPTYSLQWKAFELTFDKRYD